MNMTEDGVFSLISLLLFRLWATHNLIRLETDTNRLTFIYLLPPHFDRFPNKRHSFSGFPCQGRFP